ncbi:hypothetical protein EON63_02245 [archaeon]|nr:MAG: hypothetical protein EON63_02245 [archaeon]
MCICYTGNVLTSPIYNLDYYHHLAKEVMAAGADILCIKDMAGLLRPLEVAPFMKTLRDAVGDTVAIHFHTHATSSGSVATCMSMAQSGCTIIDSASASMSDGTSQPSLHTLLAMLQGGDRDPGINYMDLEVCVPCMGSMCMCMYIFGELVYLLPFSFASPSPMTNTGLASETCTPPSSPA